MTRDTPASTYDDDFFTWTQEQAAALRHLPPETTGIDIAHLAEEIEDLGKRDLREVGSFLELVLSHLLKIDACPGSRDIPHWRSEIRQFRRSAIRAFSASMTRSLDMASLWRAARQDTKGFLDDSGITSPMPVTYPFSLQDLLSDDFDLDHALSVLGAATTG